MLSGNYELREKLNTVSGYMQKKPIGQAISIAFLGEIILKLACTKSIWAYLGFIRFFKEFYVSQIRRRLLQARFVT